MIVLVAGDFVPRNRVEKMTESGDYSYFDEVRLVTDEVDYSIVNFESPIVDENADPIEKTGPNLKCHSNSMIAVKYAGFQCVTLANNHFYDFGEQGVYRTIEACHDNGIDYVGGGKNIEEAEKVLYKRIGNETLAIINFCENEWSIASENSGGSAPLNLIRNVHKIQEAKNNADYVLVIVHGGTEQYQLPSPRMKETYRFFVEQGADAVVNHHQHCFSGFEVFQGKPIFYGLGNLCFDYNNIQNKLWNEGYCIKLIFRKDSISYILLPYQQCSDLPKVQFITQDRDFMDQISYLNSIIDNDKNLQDSFIIMARTKPFLQFFEPINNKFLNIIKYKAKGLIPSFLSQRKKNIILELFRCESHRDVMFYLLNKEKLNNENSNSKNKH